MWQDECFQAPVALAGSLLFMVILCAATSAQLDPIPTNSPPGYSNKAIGFRYVPPSGMLDETERRRREVQEQAKALHTSNTLNALLAMSSTADDTVSTWSSITIEIYPRNAIAEPNDAKAEAQMNAWVAHSKDTSALPKSVLISGQSFTVSLFGLQEGPVKKSAVVWTTVRKGKLLSFAFAANSPDELKALTESMKTVQFF